MTNESKAEIKQKYKEWCPLTREERFERGLPLSQREFAVYHGTSEVTLSRWNEELDKEHSDISSIHSLDDYLRYLKGLAYNPKSLGKDRELYAKLLGWLTERKEETLKVEFTPADYFQITQRVIERLREELETGGGSCPVCHQFKSLRNGTRLDTEPEHAENREVATLAIPPRPE